MRAAGVDTTLTSAADAGFQVGRVVDQAVRADRLAMLVTGGRPSPCVATGALLDPGLRDAVAADPLAVQGLGDAHRPAATRTVWPDDPVDPAIAEQVDEPQDYGDRGEVPVPGQQRGVVLHRPGQSPLMCRAGGHLADRGGDVVWVRCSVQHGDLA